MVSDKQYEFVPPVGPGHFVGSRGDALVPCTTGQDFLRPSLYLASSELSALPSVQCGVVMSFLKHGIGPLKVQKSLELLLNTVK